MNALFQAVREVADFMDARGWKYCLIGGLAVQRWGEPRATLDADITLLADFGDEEKYAAALLESFRPRIPNALQFALANRVVLIRAYNGKDVDISLGALPFEERMIERSVKLEFAPGLFLPCCTAEDLFVMKAFASRPKDWMDAESIVMRQGKLDTTYIFSQLEPLCELKAAPEIIERARLILGEPK
ncbi:MAG: hypothetical protein AB7T27_02240 [Kiritimatiellia bacterium]